MVQQLALFSAIEDESYPLSVETLTILSSNRPRLFANFNKIYKPNPSLQIEKVNAKNQLVEQTRVKLSTAVPLSKLGNGAELNYHFMEKLSNDDIESFNVKSYIQDIDSNNKTNWAFQISDIPAAGNNRKLSSQTIHESVIQSSSGSVSSFIDELGYVNDFQYINVGVKFQFLSGVVMEIYKVWQVVQKDQEVSMKLITKDGFMIKAMYNVNKSTDIESLNNGSQLLLKLKTDLRDYIELDIPDRKCMDTRLNHLD
ncbi:Srb5p [Kluyveromyces lactis]|uniref:Mediator of RNA polymerase II transcription subunit 18 n=1 Tax=Kluyveromyces lactis (strain ATCC 8585 / CBS 2359 / DSM 70799 / NBRC 1267 / NRRL Y-1140 / WM37) TaxID=284590 RepID=MED18_KLULA|nr:uncharacterized protein KLLA0_D15290g [Kluyveromyces lactis]Q6CQQ0.1 RecName: Full=Mediator of RNA polymerase II transcription subunit 18; AltName: Full=Mediator complex subunit 18 [Kluyveromyces lactis NRRL Y-1140]CAH00835.1 KLLA0D15290p [Kluyveromyces lactis]|eukprot:XP_453739.1 uncharacterized protein KLLA0_D15290g [Kluyveromyces lactis]